MDVILHVELVRVGDGSPIGYAKKTIDLPCIPKVGLCVEGHPWKIPREIITVTLDIDYLHIYATVTPHQLENLLPGEMAYLYETFGWCVSEELQSASDEYARRTGQSIHARAHERL